MECQYLRDVYWIACLIESSFSSDWHSKVKLKSKTSYTLFTTKKQVMSIMIRMIHPLISTWSKMVSQSRRQERQNLPPQSASPDLQNLYRGDSHYRHFLQCQFVLDWLPWLLLYLLLLNIRILDLFHCLHINAALLSHLKTTYFYFFFFLFAFFLCFRPQMHSSQFSTI